MSTTRATRLAGALALATVAINVAWAWLFALNVQSGLTGDAFAPSSVFPNVVPAIAFMAVGFLVASRKPDNPIGWLLLAAGPIIGLPLLAQQYAAYALLAGHPGLPFGRAIAIGLNGVWIPGSFVLIMLLLLFPTGRLLSRRWRLAVWLPAVSLSLLLLASHMTELDPPFSEVENPFRYEPSAVLSTILLLPLIVGLLVGLIASAVAACASVVVRFRRSKGDEREQLKWVALAASVLPLGFVINLAAETLAPGAVGAVEAGFSLCLALFPIAIGIAILKYRLYEIDRIISRTLVYAMLTVVLGAAYAGLVLAGQALFSSLAGGSNLAIAVSTLVVAALFLPMRARLQAFVDRRFYRRRYDAQQTLERFAARLREQVELESLATDLRRAVRETMAPEHVTLWLKERR